MYSMTPTTVMLYWVPVFHFHRLNLSIAICYKLFGLPPLLPYHNICMHFRLGRYCSPDVTLVFSLVAIVYLKNMFCLPCRGKILWCITRSGGTTCPCFMCLIDTGPCVLDLLPCQLL